MKKYKVKMEMTIDFETTVDAQDAKNAKEQAIRIRNEVVFKSDNNSMTPGGYNGCSNYGSVWNCKTASMTTEEISTKKPLILLCGQSGSGKTTVANLLCRKYGLKQLESYTTRPRRSDDERGHIWSSMDVYNIYKQTPSSIIAEAEINGHKYWATSGQLDNADVYVIDLKTALELEKKMKDEREVIIVYLCCPLTTRVYRMTKRGDALEDIQKRLVNEECWDDYIATINYKRQRFDSGKDDAERVAECIMRVYNFCLTGEWK